MWDRSLSDRWCVHVDSETLEGMHSLKAAVALSDAEPQRVIMLLHEGLAEEEDADWILLERTQPLREKADLSKLRRWLWREGVQDLWWISDERLVCEDRKSLNEIQTHMAKQPNERWFILHCNTPLDESARWIELTAD